MAPPGDAGATGATLRHCIGRQAIVTIYRVKIKDNAAYRDDLRVIAERTMRTLKDPRPLGPLSQKESKAFWQGMMGRLLVPAQCTGAASSHIELDYKYRTCTGAKDDLVWGADYRPAYMHLDGYRLHCFGERVHAVIATGFREVPVLSHNSPALRSKVLTVQLT